MPHILARLRKVPYEAIVAILKADAAEHAEYALYLEHLWKNTEDSEEVIFLFRSDDMNKSREFITNVHAQALAADPKANLPEMTYLDCQDIRNTKKLEITSLWHKS